MREIDFLEAVGKVNPKYIDECITYQPPNRLNVMIKRIGAVAACFMVVIAAIFMTTHMNRPVIINKNGFYIEDGVLLRYTGSETDITIPEEVKTIADYSFLENTNREKIEIVRLGAGVRTVETNAFAGLDNLVDIIIAANNPSFITEDGLTMTSDGTILMHYDRTGETHFTLPDSVRFVAAHAVQMTELEEIDFGDTVEYIGYNAFASNTKLKAITLPDSVEYICEGAFAGCTSAVDGTIPEGAEYSDSSFRTDPFYMTLLAGQMSPGEERKRGLISPSEAILKSDLDSLTAQLEYVLAALNSDEDYKPNEDAMFGHAAATDLPPIPEGMIVPKTVDLSTYTFRDNGWNGIGNQRYDVQIIIPAGEYDIIIQSPAYEIFDSLYWSEVRFRLVDVFYLKRDIADSPADGTENQFGWTIVPEMEDERYTGFSLIHEDGTVIHHNCSYQPTEPYRFIFSPKGTRLAVEYRHTMGYYSFYVLSLNGDPLDSDIPSFYPHKLTQYMHKEYGEYEGGTLRFADEDNIEGINVYGKFNFNLHDFYETKVTYIQDDTVPHTKGRSIANRQYNINLSIPRLWVEEDGFFFDDMGRQAKNYSDITRAQLWREASPGDRDGIDENGDWAPNEIIHAGAYFDMTLLETGTNEMGIDYMLSLETGMSQPLVRYYAFFRMNGRIEFAFWVYVYDDENRDEYVETVIKPMLHSVSITPKITMSEDFDCLDMTVAELRNAYGELEFLYSEHGPGQPVYSLEKLPGVLLVFYDHNMDDPLTDNMTPDELIITENYADPVHGLNIHGYMGNHLGIPWSDVEHSPMTGYATFTAEYDDYVLSVTAQDTFPAFPEDSSDKDALTKWKSTMLEVAAGWVVEIRIISSY